MFLYFIGLSFGIQIGIQIGKSIERDKNYYYNYIEMRDKVKVLENKLE